MTEETTTPVSFPSVAMPTALLMSQEISDSAKILWMALYQFETTGGGRPFEMTVEQMMTLTGAAKPSVIKRKKELIEHGWLSHTALRGLGLTNLYATHVPGADQPAASDSAPPA